MHDALIILIIGLIGLWFGADLLIKGAKNIAKHLGVSNFLIGLALVSIGTSIPEIAVSIAGALDRLKGIETSGIVVGDALGSALSQITLLLGILALFLPLVFKRAQVRRQGTFLIASVFIVFGLSADGYLSRLDGALALVAYGAYYLFIWSTADGKVGGPKPKADLLQDAVYSLIGLGLVLLTSQVVVTSGIALAEYWGVTQEIIGIFLIGIGTGLPELSVAIASFRHKAMDISLGNLIGSNICDLLFSLGAGTIISGFVVSRNMILFDIPALLFFSCVVLYFMYTGKRVSKREGTMLIGLFVLYAFIKIFVVG